MGQGVPDHGKALEDYNLPDAGDDGGKEYSGEKRPAHKRILKYFHK